MFCTVCGSAEGASTTECPGYHISSDTLDKVYKAVLDYQNGRWVRNLGHFKPGLTYWE